MIRQFAILYRWYARSFILAPEGLMNCEFSKQENLMAFITDKTDNQEHGQQTTRFMVLTGGPGSGKSTLIDALQNAGYARSMEAGRGVIQDQIAIDGQALPWRDQVAFAELMLSWEMRSYHIAKHASGPVFFDRGVPDVVGYLRLLTGQCHRTLRKQHKCFVTTDRSLSLHLGRRSSVRIVSASRTLRRQFGPTR